MSKALFGGVGLTIAIIAAIAGAIKLGIVAGIIAVIGIVVGFISMGTGQAIVLWGVAVGAILGVLATGLQVAAIASMK